MDTPKNIAEKLQKRYQGSSVRVSILLDEVDSTMLIDALRILELHAKIYIQRIPVLQENKLRTDLQSSDLVYFDSFPSIRRRTLLYRTAVEYGDFTINHVLGCAHGCTYPCYAMNISKRYGRVESYDDWMRPRLVENALDLLEVEIPKYQSEMGFVHLSFMTDPFMYDPVNSRNNPWIENLTLKIISKLNSHGIKCTVLTKSKYPAVLTEQEYSKENEYGITLVSLDTEFHSKYEPFSPPASERIDALRALHDAGLRTWASLEPYPTPNIVQQNLQEILDSVDFVDKIVFGKWNYSSLVNEFINLEIFYTDCSDEVIGFAKSKEIPYHIKKKTPRNTKETQTLFHELP